MALTDTGTNTTMLVTPTGTNCMNGGCNDGFGWGGNGAWWLLVLFLFAFNGNGGWGGNFGGNGAMPYIMNNTTNNDVQRGFDQQAVMSGIGDLNGAVTSGFSGVNQSLCSGFAGVNQNLCNGFNSVNATVNGGFAAAEASENARQMANMQQMFTLQTGLSNQLNSISMAQQNCCCENRAAVLDSKYANAQEHCQDRYEAANNTRDIITNATGNTQMLLNTINNGIQSIQDKLCQQEIDALKTANLNLQNQLNMATLRESQVAQTAQIVANNEAQTRALEQYLNPPPIPAYMVQNPNCCNQNAYNCGCGCN